MNNVKAVLSEFFKIRLPIYLFVFIAPTIFYWGRPIKDDLDPRIEMALLLPASIAANAICFMVARAIVPKWKTLTTIQRGLMLETILSLALFTALYFFYYKNSTLYLRVAIGSFGLSICHALIAYRFRTRAPQT